MEMVGEYRAFGYLILEELFEAGNFIYPMDGFI
jgi:hypothetical protein